MSKINKRQVEYEKEKAAKAIDFPYHIKMREVFPELKRNCTNHWIFGGDGILRSEKKNDYIYNIARIKKVKISQCATIYLETFKKLEIEEDNNWRIREQCDFFENRIVFNKEKICLDLLSLQCSFENIAIEEFYLKLISIEFIARSKYEGGIPNIDFIYTYIIEGEVSEKPLKPASNIYRDDVMHF